MKKQTELPVERQRCLIFSRVVGYLSPTKNWNPGKLSELKDRKVFEI